jgi:hypothetical protein
MYLSLYNRPSLRWCLATALQVMECERLSYIIIASHARSITALPNLHIEFKAIGVMGLSHNYICHSFIKDTGLTLWWKIHLPSSWEDFYYTFHLSCPSFTVHGVLSLIKYIHSFVILTLLIHKVRQRKLLLLHLTTLFYHLFEFYWYTFISFSVFIIYWP